jgi:hypothetical protein
VNAFAPRCYPDFYALGSGSHLCPSRLSTTAAGFIKPPTRRLRQPAGYGLPLGQNKTFRMPDASLFRLPRSNDEGDDERPRPPCRQRESPSPATARVAGTKAAIRAPMYGTKRNSIARMPPECRVGDANDSQADADQQTEARVDSGLHQEIAAKPVAGFIERPGGPLQVARAGQANEAVA